MPHNLPDKIREAMVNFQYLEMMLKNAIIRIEQVIQTKVEPEIFFSADEDRINKMTLVSAAEKFGAYMKDADFKKKVGAIAHSRNKLAHRMFLSVEFKMDGDEEILKEVDAIHKASETASNLADYVMDKSQHIAVDLPEFLDRPED